jgi:hypothetical protein
MMGETQCTDRRHLCTGRERLEDVLASVRCRHGALTVAICVPDVRGWRTSSRRCDADTAH